MARSAVRAQVPNVRMSDWEDLGMAPREQSAISPRDRRTAEGECGTHRSPHPRGGGRERNG